MRAIQSERAAKDEAVSPERRAEVRRRVLKGAVLSFNRGFSSFECVVRNLSDGGARLSLGETFALPTTVDIRLGDEPKRTAYVRWRTPVAIGIQFADG